MAVTYAVQPLKPAFTLNTFIGGDETLPETLGLSNGGFITAYNAHGEMTLNFYGSDHEIIGTDEGAYAYPQRTLGIGQPQMAQLTGGEIIVVWDDDDPGDGGGTPGLKDRFFDSIGRQGPEFDLGSQVTDYATPDVAALSNGGFVVAYNYDGDTSFRTFDKEGTNVSGSVEIAAPTGMSDSQVVGLKGGGFVEAWTDTSGSPSAVKVGIYGNNGHQIHAPFDIDTAGAHSKPALAALGGGGFAIAYADDGWDNEGGSTGITLQLRNGAGDNLTPGSFIHVNTGSADSQETDPSLAILSNGFILVSWTRPFSGTDNDIYGRLYDQAGHAITVGVDTDEFVISGNGVDQVSPSVAALLTGEFIASYQEANGDGLGAGIRGSVSALVRTVTTGDTATRFTGDSLRDSITGGAGRDTLSGGDGADTIEGGALGDLIHGGLGDDLVQGGLDSDTVDGGAGDDIIYGVTQAQPSNSVFADLLTGFSGHDRITGADGADTIHGGRGRDTVQGGGGADLITGDASKDTIDGGAGQDTVFGGADKDLYVLSAIGDSTSAAPDRLMDWTPADVVSLSLIDANTHTAGDQKFHLVDAFTHHRAELVVAYHAAGDYAGYTSIQGDVNGDGAADFTLLMQGDRHTFQHFVY